MAPFFSTSLISSKLLLQCRSLNVRGVRMFDGKKLFNNESNVVNLVPIENISTYCVLQKEVVRAAAEIDIAIMKLSRLNSHEVTQ